MGAHMNLGLNKKADSLVTILENKKGQLSILERYFLDFCKGWLTGNWSASLNAARQLARLAPGPWFQYMRGWTAFHCNRPGEALEVLKELNPEKSWFAYWWVVTMSYHALGDYERELIEARRGREQYPENSQTLLNAIRALSALGRIDKVDECINESLSLTQPLLSPGYLMRIAALELKKHGFMIESQRYFNRTLDWYNSFPPDRYRAGRGITLYFLGRWEEAQSIFEDLYKRNTDNISYRGSLGVIAVRKGDRENAMKIFEELRNLDRPYLRGANLVWCARISALLGEKQQAVNLMREAFNRGCSFDLDYLTDIDFESLWEYEPFKELLKPRG